MPTDLPAAADLGPFRPPACPAPRSAAQGCRNPRATVEMPGSPANAVTVTDAMFTGDTHMRMATHERSFGSLRSLRAGPASLAQGRPGCQEALAGAGMSFAPGRSDVIRETAALADELIAALRACEYTAVRAIMCARHAGDAAALLMQLRPDDQVVVFRVLPRRNAAAVFE